MDRDTEELINLSEMEFVQFWRKYSKDFLPHSKEKMKNFYLSAFYRGAAAVQELRILSSD